MLKRRSTISSRITSNATYPVGHGATLAMHSYARCPSLRLTRLLAPSSLMEAFAWRALMGWLSNNEQRYTHEDIPASRIPLLLHSLGVAVSSPSVGFGIAPIGSRLAGIG